MRYVKMFGTYAAVGLMALASSAVLTPQAMAGQGANCNIDPDCDDGRDCNGAELCVFNGNLGTCLPGTFVDCDSSGVADACEIEDGIVEDCDANSVPDSCDIAGGATDCNANGIPDVCDITGRSIDQTLTNLDNGVGADVSSLIPSPFNFTGGDSSDGDFCSVNNGISDGGSDMYDCANYLNTNLASQFLYTDGVLVASDAIFGTGSSYHTSKFPALFVMQADNISIDMFEITGNNGADSDGSLDTAMFDVNVAGRQSTVYVKRVYGAGDPSINHIIIVPGGGSGITHTFSNDTNDDRDTLTGLSGIDHIAYLLVARSSGQRLSDADVLALVDEFVVNAGLGVGDCNGNSIPDDCDITSGTSPDVDSNGTPDECQPDCNSNNIPDRYEIRTEQASDCNNNRIPDDCDLEEGTSQDCNNNSIPDECNDGLDCNRNNILDECDFASGFSMDCNANNVPDECDVRGGGESIVYFVFETSNDTVYRLEDKNGDGDANDEGEGWAYGVIDGVEGLDVDQRNGDLYTAEESNELIYRYRDLNGDGDALDGGEKFLFADDTGIGEAEIENIAFDEFNGRVLIVYEDASAVVWFKDLNGDGDALDAGERGDFATIGSDNEEITVDARNGDVYIGDNNSGDDVWRLSTNGNDLGSIGTLGHEALDFSEGTGELFIGEEDFNHIHRWVNGVENRYAEISGENGEALAVNPLDGTLFAGDQLNVQETLADESNGVIVKFVDLNGDGDALDEGERTLYHDFIHQAESESETEGLAVYGRPNNLSADGNDNGVPDECENRGGGAILSGFGFTDVNGFYTAGATTAQQQPLARVIVNSAPAGDRVDWGVDPTQLDGPPGPGTGTFAGFANGQAMARTLTVTTTSPQGSFNVTVELIFTQAELNTAGIVPEDVQIQVLDETATPPTWGPAGTNDVGEAMPTGVVGGFGFFRDNAARVVFWVVRDELSIFAVGAAEPTPAQEPPAPQPQPEPAPEQPVPVDTDGDGVTDDIDQCPDTTAGATVDETGCEVMAPPADMEDMTNQCGQGVCGTMGGGAMMIMLLGLVGMKTGLRRRKIR